MLDVATQGDRKQLTPGDFVVGSFDWSPDGARHRLRPPRRQRSGRRRHRGHLGRGRRLRRAHAVVAQDGPDSNPHVVARRHADRVRLRDGQAVLLLPEQRDRRRSRRVDGAPRASPTRSTRIRTSIAWTPGRHPLLGVAAHVGVLFTARSARRSRSRGTRVRDEWIGSGFSLTPDGRRSPSSASGPREFPEVYVAPVQTMAAATKLSDAGAQIASWPKHTREVIRWKSQDGAEIEGVLHKPADFQPGRRYPLLVVIHGGPTGVSRPVPYGSATATIRSMPSSRRARSSSSPTTAAAPATARSSARSTCATSASATRGTCSRASTRWCSRASSIAIASAHGLEPGRLHLRVPDHEAFRSLQGDLGRRRHLELDDVLREHRHSSVHAAVPEGDAVGRSEDLRRHVADDLHQAGARRRR